MLPQYLIALYQQSLQYNYITNYKHSTLASSNSSAKLEQVIEPKSTNQLQRETLDYNYDL